MSEAAMRPIAKTVARGYGYGHKKTRAAIQQDMDRGVIYRCWRCRGILLPHQPWDLGHDDDDPTKTKYRGPEHRLEADCPAGGNRKAGWKKLNVLKRQRAAQPKRWLLSNE